MIRLLEFRPIDGFVYGDGKPGLYTGEGDTMVNADEITLVGGDILATEIEKHRDAKPTVWMVVKFPLVLHNPSPELLRLLGVEPDDGTH